MKRTKRKILTTVAVIIVSLFVERLIEMYWERKEKKCKILH